MRPTPLRPATLLKEEWARDPTGTELPADGTTGG